VKSPGRGHAKDQGPAFTAGLGAPARRALANVGITSLRQLAAKSEKEILALHGLGPSSMPNLRQALADAGLRFRE
jgi:hypothetical protein